MGFSWLGEKKSLSEILIELGHSKQSLKKSEVAKKSLERLIDTRGEVDLPASLMNRGDIYPKYGPYHPKPVVIEKRGDILAISKPSGVHCHPFHYGESDNLLSFLREEGFFDFLNINKEKMDRGLLYRLDLETSGLVLLTKNEEVLKEAREGEFIKRKLYYALVEGEYEGPNGLTHVLSTTGKKIKQDLKEGKEAHLKVVENEYLLEQNMSLLQVELKEGLRHQIRVQLSLSGYPIVGDTLYGGIPNDLFGLHCLCYETKQGRFEDKSFLNQI